MSPSLRQIKPKRPIAEFGKNNNPLFRVVVGKIPGEEPSENREPFLVRDADEGLPSRLIAAGELENIDSDAGIADMKLEIDTSPSEATYTPTPADMRIAVGAVMKDAGVETVHLVGTNLPESTLRQMGCEAVYDEVELRLPVAA